MSVPGESFCMSCETFCMIIGILLRPGIIIATDWSPMRLKMPCWRQVCQVRSPAGNLPYNCYKLAHKLAQVCNNIFSHSGLEW